MEDVPLRLHHVEQVVELLAAELLELAHAETNLVTLCKRCDDRQHAARSRGPVTVTCHRCHCHRCTCTACAFDSVVAGLLTIALAPVVVALWLLREADLALGEWMEVRERRRRQASLSRADSGAAGDSRDARQRSVRGWCERVGRAAAARSGRRFFLTAPSWGRSDCGFRWLPGAIWETDLSDLWEEMSGDPVCSDPR